MKHERLTRRQVPGISRFTTINVSVGRFLRTIGEIRALHGASSHPALARASRRAYINPPPQDAGQFT